MIKYKNQIIAAFAFGSLLFSCKGVFFPEEESKTPMSKEKYIQRVDSYITSFSGVAMQQMKQYKIPASITLAQGILESAAGNGKLAREGNNHFGIKCHSSWDGGRMYHDDDAKGECFRKYANVLYSFQDHSLFLSERKRYMDLFKLSEDDYKAWAKGLRKAGYATDKKYASKLISIIERYKLYLYDAKVLGKSEQDAKTVTQKSSQYTVKKGDTLYSIARKHKLKVTELKELNGLSDDVIFEGQVLYTKPMPKDF